MAVVNITPQNGIRNFPAGTVPGIMHVYCIGPAETGYVIQIGQEEPSEHYIQAGYTDTYHINGQEFNFRNYGPSTLQLLWSTEVALKEVSETVESRIEQQFHKVKQR